MSFTSWLSSLTQPRRRTVRKAAPRTTRLSVELLEGREVPAAIATPAGLNPGDHFTVVYATSGKFDALSQNIGTYNSQVTSQAAALTYNGVSQNWLVLGATPTVNNHDALLNSTAPVYSPTGTFLGANGFDFLNSTTAVININQNLQVQPSAFVWIGGWGPGGAVNALGLGDRGGQRLVGVGMIGSPMASGGISANADNAWKLHSLYGFASFVVAASVVDTTTTVTAADATYDGLAHGATATVTPGTAAGTMTFLYSGTGATAYSSSAAPTEAGTYHVVASFTPADAAAFNPSSGSADFTIAKATPTVTVNAAGGNYNGSAFAATGSVTGVNNTGLGAPTFQYYLASDTTFSSPLPGAPTNAGDYVVVAEYAATANYTSASANKSFSILSAQQQAAVLTSIVNNLVSTGVLDRGDANALTTKLDGATDKFNSGNTNAGVNKMKAFKNQVKAFLNSGRLSAAQAQMLTDAANAIIVSALA